MKIYFRACEKPQTVSGVARWQGENKTDIVKKCWLSMQPTITEDDETILFNDNMLQETVDFLSNSTKSKVTVIDIPEHKVEDRLHTFQLLKYFKMFINESDEEEIHYLVEDDYLHVSYGIGLIKEMFNHWNGFIVPYDYPDRYRFDEVSSKVLIGPSCHWRTVSSGTYTFAGKTKIFKKHFDIMDDKKPHNPTVEMFKKTPCISPLPGVASHLTPTHMTPLVNWVSIWDGLDVS